jgi:transcriptional regulator with XRE-family HTH domain
MNGHGRLPVRLAASGHVKENAARPFLTFAKPLILLYSSDKIHPIRNTLNTRISNPGATMSIDVGERLRFVRSRNKLSQRELAKRSGVTNSTISLIESNQMNPSVGALKRILDGIPMGMAEFFALEPDRPRKAFYRSDELSEIGKGQISFRQVGDNLFGRALQILKERYEPGGDTGRIPLVHDGEEGGIILSGRLEVTVDSERRILGPGDAYYFESRRPHRFRCVGAKPCELISACTPPTF